MKFSSEPFVSDENFKPEKYFDNLVGAAPPDDQQPLKIKIRVFKDTAPYIDTKPIHKNQKLVDEAEDGSITIELNLYNTYELKQTLLGYGKGVEVMEPKELRDEMKKIISEMNKLYHD